MKVIRKASKRCSRYLHEILERRRLLSTVSWTAVTGGLWSTAADWSGGSVPGSGDDVVINLPGIIPVILAGSVSVHSLDLSRGSLVVSGGTLSLASSSTVDTAGSLTLNSATLSLASGATLTNNGTIAVNPGSSLNDSGDYSESSTGTLTLPTGTPSSGVGTNLLSNPGFEAPSAGSSTTTAANAWGQYGSSYLSTQHAHSGAQSLLESGTSGVFQSFAVSPGVTYLTSVYAYTPTSNRLRGQEGAYLQINFLDSNGNEITSSDVFATVLDAQNTAGQWTNETTTFTAPSTAASIAIYLQAGPYTNISGTTGGVVYWDDAQFGPQAIESANVTAANISTDGTINIGGGDTITATQSFTQTADGILNFELAGPAAGNFYGSIAGDGPAALDGTINASLVNGYSPTLNDGFTLISYTSETGSFANMNLPTGSTWTFQSTLSPTYFGISAVPTTLTTTINASATIGASSSNLIGANLAYWDDQLTTAQTQSLVQSAGLSIFRFPGGSASDDFHFNLDDNYGDYIANSVAQFSEFITNVGGTGIVTVDYGSGSPQEAEAELAYLEGSPNDTTPIGYGLEWNDVGGAWTNVNWRTVGYWATLRASIPLEHDDGLNFLRLDKTTGFPAIKNWEIGNEEYGGWEVDHHGTPGPGNVSTGAPHDPATYAAFAAAFAAFDAADYQLPSVSIGIDSEDPTGQEDNNWTQNIVADMYNAGYMPGFISDHEYVQQAGTENDSFLLNGTVSDPSSQYDWSTRYTEYEAMLQQVIGGWAPYVNIWATEYNSNPGTEGKQMTSLVNGLFIADSIGSLLDSGYSAGLVWDLRNGWVTSGNNSPSLYGWREGGDEGILGDPNVTELPDTGAYVPYPSYFGEQLASEMMQNGGSAVQAVSNYGELAVYSVMEPNGDLDLMVINKNPDAALTTQFDLSNFAVGGQAQIWQYSEQQDYAQSQSSIGASSLASYTTTLSLSNDAFSYSFPAYSMTVLDLSPAPALQLAAWATATPSPQIGNLFQLAVAGSEGGSGANLTYTWTASGPGSVSYTGSTNGTNAASNITALVSQPGVYTFSVTIFDQSGQSISTSVQAIALPVFAFQSGSTLTIDMNSFGPITIWESAGVISVTEDGFTLNFSGISGITLVGAATEQQFVFDGPISQPLTLVGDDYTDIAVSSGTLNIAGGSGPSLDVQTIESLSITYGASVMVAPSANAAGRTLLVMQSLNIAGWTDNWAGTLDLTNNDLEVQSGDIGTVTNQLMQGYAGSSTWQGSGGILSSAAAADTTYLTTLGVLQNLVPGSDDTGIYGSTNPFEGTAPPAGAILIKYTWYGDANLDGKIDGSDYSQIDNGCLLGLSGWSNGDFDYNGNIDGSDYTLIDNAYNTQGASLSAEVAGQIASSAKSRRRLIATPDNLEPATQPAFGTVSPIGTASPSWADEVLNDSDPQVS